MHSVWTFILRLLVDPAEPEALRGALQPVPEGETQAFADSSALLALLRRWTSRPAQFPGCEGSPSKAVGPQGKEKRAVTGNSREEAPMDDDPSAA